MASIGLGRFRFFQLISQETCHWNQPYREYFSSHRRGTSPFNREYSNHFIAAFLVYPRLDPSWRFRGDYKLSSRKLPKGFCEDKEHFERHFSGLFTPTIEWLNNVDWRQAYKLLSELCENVGDLDKATICRIHSRLMKTCQYTDLHYIPAGKTRTETRKTVIVAGTYKIECCPFPVRSMESLNISVRWSRWEFSVGLNPFLCLPWIISVFFL